LCDAKRDFFLNGEHVVHLAIVALGPGRAAGGGFDQLGRDAETVPGAPNRAFEDVVCAQLLTDNRGGDLFVPKSEHFGAWENLQLRDFRELRDDVFRHPVAKVFVLFRAALIFEVQDGHGFSCCQRRRGGCAARDRTGFVHGGATTGIQVALEALQVRLQFGRALAAQVKLLLK
jgi:hypothetical protein